MMLPETTKSKCPDEMHYACIISMVGKSHWEVFLKIRYTKLLKIQRDLAYNFTTVFEKYMWRIWLFLKSIIEDEDSPFYFLYHRS